MPKLKPATKKRIDSQRLKILQKSKNMKEFGYKVAEIGSKGGKNLDDSARETGRQILANIGTDLLAKLDEGKIKFSEKVVEVLKNAAEGKLDTKTFEQMKWAVEQGLKVGVLGGYSPTKSQSIELKIEAKLQDPELLKKEQEYNELIRKKYLKGNENAEIIDEIYRSILFKKDD